MLKRVGVIHPKAKMASSKELRRRIKSVKNTAQITKAMEMVAGTKMRRAQNQAISGRPYIEALNKSLYQVLNTGDKISSSLLLPNESAKTAILVLTTDKSLCGGLNTNIFRYIATMDTHQDWDLRKELTYYTVGKKGRQFIVRSTRTLSADFENYESVDFSQVLKIQRVLRKLFLDSEISSVYLLYPHFVSVLQQIPTLIKILPIQKTWGLELTGLELKRQIFLEPEKDVLVDYLLNHYLDAQIYQALLETKASEHSSRMIAMKNATDNAIELVEDLKLGYNQIRQDTITRELSEISGAALALE